MPERPEDRLERIVRDLLRGRRLKLHGRDAEDKEAIIMAARLAAARQGPQRMTPAFRQRLARELEAAPPEGWVTRRAALVAGFAAVAGAVGGGVLERALGPGQIAPATVGNVIQPDNPKWIDVGALGDFAADKPRMVKAGAISAFVFRRNQTVSAVSTMCSDLPCELWWDDTQDLLSCPCHNRNFTFAGSPTDNIRYPIPPLDVVQVRVTPEDRVEVLGV